MLSRPSENVIYYFSELLNQVCHSKANVIRSFKKKTSGGKQRQVWVICRYSNMWYNVTFVHYVCKECI